MNWKIIFELEVSQRINIFFFVILVFVSFCLVINKVQYFDLDICLYFLSDLVIFCIYEKELEKYLYNSLNVFVI